jgi:hypothetical protein
MQIKLPPVIDTLIKIVRSELGPDALPASTLWLRISIVAYALSLFINGLLDYAPLKATGVALVGTAILIGFAAGSLYLVGLGKRLTQALIGLAGAGTIINLALFVFHLILIIGLPAEMPVEDIAGYLAFPIYFWNAVVFMAIFNTALSSGKIVGVAMSVSYLVVLLFWVPSLFK